MICVYTLRTWNSCHKRKPDIKASSEINPAISMFCPEALTKCLELVLSITSGNLSCSKLPISIKEQLAPVSSRALMCLFSMQIDITEENNLELSLFVLSLPSSHLYLLQVEFHALWPLLPHAWQKRRGHCR